MPKEIKKDAKKEEANIKERAERTQACAKELDAILKKYNCKIKSAPPTLFAE